MTRIKALPSSAKIISPSNSSTALSLVSNVSGTQTHKAALAIDGAMFTLFARDRNRQPDLRSLAAWAESVATAPLETKQWFDATPSGEENSFHFSTKSAGYSVHLGRLTTRTDMIDELEVTRHKQVGVDVDLALTTYRSYLAGTWTTLVLAAGDGDFYRLAEYLAEHGVRVILLSDRSSTSRKLEEVVSETYDMSGLLETITRPRPSSKAA